MVKPVFVTFNVISNYVETEKTKENTETTDWKDLPFRKKKKMNETQALHYINVYMNSPKSENNVATR